MADEPLVPWPTWRWEGSSWWLTIAGSILAAAVMVLPTLAVATLSVRIATLVGSFLVAPFLVLTVAYIARSFVVVSKRSLSHRNLANELAATRLELRQTKQMLSTLVRGQHELPTFEVDRVLRYGEDVYIAIPLSMTTLELGDRLALMDDTDGMILGEFEITDVKRAGYQARNVRPLNPVWLGFIHESKQMELPPPPNALALLIAKGKKNE